MVELEGVQHTVALAADFTLCCVDLLCLDSVGSSPLPPSLCHSPLHLRVSNLIGSTDLYGPRVWE